ncbi:hypothetical protein [Limosilactobacillus panis]|uniref:DUF1659 domain-containing protein n=1 Tax=Limosilactobacillus panis TaxID=47493 RepID=A0ABT7VQ27_9LACO|nr:hypothetical protein [Limosilactobacillus panis]MDM8334179.1 hypothetical protein [Limosilactobacillus panis]HJA21597.1 hypothetical protein [Candidatus Limosilactobacillus intestinipullorum]
MSMERQFKSAKLQLTLVGDKHPKGAKHLLNNVANGLTSEQLDLITTAMESLTTEKCTDSNIITTEEFIAE